MSYPTLLGRLLRVSWHAQEEQHRLKQELAQVAITLNMEAQKRRQMAVDGEQSGKKATLKKIEVGSI